MQSQVPNFYAISLNNHAMKLFHVDNNYDTERCLIRALLVCTMQEMPPPEDLLVMEKEKVQQEHLDTSWKCLEHECQHNYMKGMRVYFEPFNIHASSACDGTIILKTIFFNLGICYIRSKQPEEAYAYFSKALSLQAPQRQSKDPQQSQSTHYSHVSCAPSDIMILHNIGFINYAEKRYAEALSNLSEVLRMLVDRSSQKYSHSHIITCMNSIGIVTLHTNDAHIDKNVERKALQLFMETARAKQKKTHNKLPPGSTRTLRYDRRSIVDVILSRIKEIGIELIKQEQKD